MNVSKLTDAEVRAEYLKLLGRIDKMCYEKYDEGGYNARQEFWEELGYSEDEVPEES